MISRQLWQINFILAKKRKKTACLFAMANIQKGIFSLSPSISLISDFFSFRFALHREWWTQWRPGNYTQRGNTTKERGRFHLPWKQRCFCWYIWKKSGPIMHCDLALGLRAPHRPFLPFHRYTVTVHGSPAPSVPGKAIPRWDGLSQGRLCHCQDGLQVQTAFSVCWL